MDDNGVSSYRRFLSGDESAFDEIMITYRVPLIGFIRRWVRDEGDAEDIAIDVFAYVLTYPGRYDFSTSLKTYLFMLGRSRAIDHLRRLRRRPTVSLGELPFESEATASPEEDVVRAERGESVKRAIERLPEKMRTAICLVYYEEMSYEEVAGVMRISVKAVDNLLYRAKGKLRSIIGEEGVL